MINCARKVVIVADRSKFGRDAMIRVADLSDIDQVVTDNALDLESQQMLKDNGIECVLT
jgi:DeoR/GlpR family transcriptional regulator of sugar metabolism